MDNEKIFFYDGTSTRANQVRVLVFNELINLYSEEDNAFLKSFPIKGSSVVRTGARYFLYPGNDTTEYLQFDINHPEAVSLKSQVENANASWASRLMKQRIIVLLLLMLGLIVGAYFAVITLVPAIGTKLIDREMETELGNSLREVMLQQEKMIGATPNVEKTAALQSFAGEIKLSDEYPTNITVVNSSIVNAYALPGGQIVVYTGMLDKIQDAGSLAALLAHESSHVNERHSLRSLLRSAADGIILSVIFSDASGVTAGLVSNAETLRGLQYSRSIEREADEEAMQLMLKNNIDLRGMKSLMEILKKEGDVPGSVSFLSSHPLTTERIKAADAFIKQNPQKSIQHTQLDNAFKKIKGEW